MLVPVGEIKKQIEENESLRFGSAPIWNTFLQPYRHTGAAKRGETDFLRKSFAWSKSGRRPDGCARRKWEASRNDHVIRQKLLLLRSFSLLLYRPSSPARCLPSTNSRRHHRHS